ncbi:MAG: GxxExxY protein [Candidatus Cloacimonadota bacterium]|nr:GxxExxY protein [Candidatus Cloacimonadota bacterium]
MHKVELLEKDFCYKLTGFAMKIMNSIGHGFREKTYENAFCVELLKNNVPFSQQKKFSIYYENEIIDDFIPDLVVDNRIIIELKTVETINNEHKGQLLNYLRVTGIKVGLIINFKHSQLEWKRMVLDKAR